MKFVDLSARMVTFTSGMGRQRRLCNNYSVVVWKKVQLSSMFCATCAGEVDPYRWYNPQCVSWVCKKHPALGFCIPPV